MTLWHALQQGSLVGDALAGRQLGKQAIIPELHETTPTITQPQELNRPTTACVQQGMWSPCKGGSNSTCACPMASSSSSTSACSAGSASTSAITASARLHHSVTFILTVVLQQLREEESRHCKSPHAMGCPGPPKIPDKASAKGRQFACCDDSHRSVRGKTERVAPVAVGIGAHPLIPLRHSQLRNRS